MHANNFINIFLSSDAISASLYMHKHYILHTCRCRQKFNIAEVSEFQNEDYEVPKFQNEDYEVPEVRYVARIHSTSQEHGHYIGR